MAKIGAILGEKYEILKKIGQGGMSVVYLAMDIRLNKQWAMKEIKNHEGENAELLLKGLQMEANVLKMVDHPVLPRIVDVIENGGSIYVVMDYIEGRTMDVVLREKGAQPQEQVIQWGKDLCSALAHLHAMSPPIIYRDMKPSNIMLKPDGTVKLIDFGTAKEFDMESIADTVALGTVGYAAPEQFGDSSGRGLCKTDVRTDIYSLGVTLYHMVTGKNPGEPPYVMKPIRYWDTSLSSGLEKIIYKATQLDPDERYQTCDELFFDLEHYKKLEDTYRKACFQKIRTFLITFALMLFNVVLAVVGYTGKEKERHNDYESLIRAGFEHTLRGEYEDASEKYLDAITEVDGRQSKAYLELLTLHRDYMDNPDIGLSQVSYYIDQEYEGIHKNQEVLFRVAMDYFEVLQDYKASAYYFSMMDEKEFPEATYYRIIALSMVEMNVDYKIMCEDMKCFEEMVDGSGTSMQKLMNYRLLCVTYARYLDRMEQAASGLVRVAGKGLQMLELYEDDSIKAEYYTFYHHYLSIAYEKLGNMWITEKPDLAKSYYDKALENCDYLLSMVSGTDYKTIGSITDRQLREAKYCEKASIYETLCQYERACEIYEQAEMEYGTGSIDLYVGHLSLVCKMEENNTSDIEKWNQKKILEIYHKGCQVQDIDRDYRWKQLTQKLAPILKKSGL